MTVYTLACKAGVFFVFISLLTRMQLLAIVEVLFVGITYANSEF
jgi:hypothetical protein